MVAQKADDHEVGTAHARELADTHEDTEPERRRNGGTLQKLRHRPVNDGRYLEFDRHVREEPVQEGDDTEDDEERSAELPHEVRRVEEMQDFERAEPYREVCRENARDVHASDLQDFSPRELQPEEERYRDEKNRERAGMHAVEERRYEHERQEPRAALACAPNERRCGGAEFQNEYPEDKDPHGTRDDENSSHITE